MQLLGGHLEVFSRAGIAPDDASVDTPKRNPPIAAVNPTSHNRDAAAYRATLSRAGVRCSPGGLRGTGRSYSRRRRQQHRQQRTPFRECDLLGLPADLYSGGATALALPARIGLPSTWTKISCVCTLGRMRAATHADCGMSTSKLNGLVEPVARFPFSRPLLR